MKTCNYNIANKERRFNWVFFPWSSEYDCRNMYTIKLLKKKLFYQNHLQYSSSQSLFALGKLRQSAQDFVEIGQIKQHGILEEIGRFQAETCFASFEKQVYVAKTQELKTRNILLQGVIVIEVLLTCAMVGFKLTSFISIQPGSILLSSLHNSTPSLRMAARSAMVLPSQLALWSGRIISHRVSHLEHSRHSSSLQSLDMYVGSAIAMVSNHYTGCFKKYLPSLVGRFVST